MPKKEKATTNMYVRDLPNEIWEKVDRLCRQRKIARRQFIEQALAFFEDPDKQSREEARIQQARLEVSNILENLKDVEELTKIPPKIEALRKTVPGLGDDRLRLKSLLYLRKLELLYKKLLKEVIPEPRMPDDIEVFKDWWAEKMARVDYWDTPINALTGEELYPGYQPKTLDQAVEEFRQLFEAVETKEDAKKDEPVKPQREQPVVAVPNADPPNPDQDKAKEKPPAQEGKEKIQTARFGRGFEDWVKETDGDE